MALIFISYRRSDSAYATGRIYDRLVQRFAPPENMVFMDVDAISLGMDFKAKIEEEVSKCDGVVAIIGRNWTGRTDQPGDARVLQLDDFVRIELAAALRRGIPVIPVFVDGAHMPPASDLPGDLSALVLRNGIDIGHTSFDADVARLVKGLERSLEQIRSHEAEATDASEPSQSLGPSSEQDRDDPRWATSRSIGAPRRGVDADPPIDTLLSSGWSYQSKRRLAIAAILALAAGAAINMFVGTSTTKPTASTRTTAASAATAPDTAPDTVSVPAAGALKAVERVTSASEPTSSASAQSSPRPRQTTPSTVNKRLDEATAPMSLPPPPTAFLGLWAAKFSGQHPSERFVEVVMDTETFCDSPPCTVKWARVQTGVTTIGAAKPEFKGAEMMVSIPRGASFELIEFRVQMLTKDKLTGTATRIISTLPNFPREPKQVAMTRVHQ